VYHINDEKTIKININDEKGDLMNITQFRKYFNIAKGANMSVKIHTKFGYKFTPPHLIPMHHFLF
jgi:D-Tyr-tRNAtyr deacylase